MTSIVVCYWAKEGEGAVGGILYIQMVGNDCQLRCALRLTAQAPVIDRVNEAGPQGCSRLSPNFSYAFRRLGVTHASQRCPAPFPSPPPPHTPCGCDPLAPPPFAQFGSKEAAKEAAEEHKDKSKKSELQTVSPVVGARGSSYARGA